MYSGQIAIRTLIYLNKNVCCPFMQTVAMVLVSKRTSPGRGRDRLCDKLLQRIEGDYRQFIVAMLECHGVMLRNFKSR